MLVLQCLFSYALEVRSVCLLARLTYFGGTQVTFFYTFLFWSLSLGTSISSALCCPFSLSPKAHSTPGLALSGAGEGPGIAGRGTALMRLQWPVGGCSRVQAGTTGEENSGFSDRVLVSLGPLFGLQRLSEPH